MRASEILKKVLAVLILFGFFAGWLTFVACILEIGKIRDARTWPTRRGVITHSYVRHIYYPHNGRFWRAEIAGTYLDNGERFGVRRTHHGFYNGRQTRKQVEALVEKYPVNTILNVYAEPKKPSNAIFENDVPETSTWIALWISLALGLLPFGLYLYGKLTNHSYQGDT